MEASWQKIYSSALEHQVKIVQAVLNDVGINSVIVNKKDSVYHFGEVELYVQGENVMKAKQIINKEQL